MSNVKVPFGKYKGHSVNSLPYEAVGYFNWLRKQDDSRNTYLFWGWLFNESVAEPKSSTPEHNKLQNNFLDSDYVDVFLTHLGLRCKKSKVLFEESNWDVVLPVIEIGGKSIGNIHVEIKPTVGEDYPEILRTIKSRGTRSCNSPWGKVLLIGKLDISTTTREKLVEFFDSGDVRVVFQEDLNSLLSLTKGLGQVSDISQLDLSTRRTLCCWYLNKGNVPKALDLIMVEGLGSVITFVTSQWTNYKDLAFELIKRQPPLIKNVVLAADKIDRLYPVIGDLGLIRKLLVVDINSPDYNFSSPEANKVSYRLSDYDWISPRIAKYLESCCTEKYYRSSILFPSFGNVTGKEHEKERATLLARLFVSHRLDKLSLPECLREGFVKELSQIATNQTLIRLLTETDLSVYCVQDFLSFLSGKKLERILEESMNFFIPDIKTTFGRVETKGEEPRTLHYLNVYHGYKVSRFFDSLTKTAEEKLTLIQWRKSTRSTVVHHEDIPYYSPLIRDHILINKPSYLSKRCSCFKDIFFKQVNCVDVPKELSVNGSLSDVLNKLANDHHVEEIERSLKQAVSEYQEDITTAKLPQFGNLLILAVNVKSNLLTDDLRKSLNASTDSFDVIIKSVEELDQGITAKDVSFFKR